MGMNFKDSGIRSLRSALLYFSLGVRAVLMPVQMLLTGLACRTQEQATAEDQREERAEATHGEKTVNPFQSSQAHRDSGNGSSGLPPFPETGAGLLALHGNSPTNHADPIRLTIELFPPRLRPRWFDHPVASRSDCRRPGARFCGD